MSTEKRTYRMWAIVVDGIGPIDTCVFNSRRAAKVCKDLDYPEIRSYRVQRVAVTVDPPKRRAKR